MPLPVRGQSFSYGRRRGSKHAASEQDEEQAGNDGEGANDMVVVDLK